MGTFPTRQQAEKRPATLNSDQPKFIQMLYPVKYQFDFFFKLHIINGTKNTPARGVLGLCCTNIKVFQRRKL